MKVTIISLLLLSVVLTAKLNNGVWEGLQEEGDVIVLNDSNFHETIRVMDYALVEFYAPWCGHCQQLKPEFERAAKELKAMNPAIPLIKVDATESEKLGTEFQLQGYPTLKWYSDGEYQEYQGPRKANGIVKWIKKKTGAATTAIANAEELEAIKTTKKLLLVFFGDLTSSAFQIFNRVARNMEGGVIFVHSTDSALSSQHNNGVVLWNTLTKQEHAAEMPFTYESLKAWIQSNLFENVMTLQSTASVNRIFTDQQKACVIFLKDRKTHNDLVGVFEKVAETLKGKMIFAKTFSSSKVGNSIIDYIGAKRNALPEIRILVPVNEDVASYQYTGDLSDASAITAFFESYMRGEVKRFYRTQEVPATNDEPVKVVVGKTWDSLVMNEDKDVMVEYYAPWCSYCKKLAPKYQKLAKSLEHVQDRLTISMMDGTENDVPALTPEKYPTIYFFKKGDKSNPVEYKGGNSVGAITKFLKKNVSFTWVEPERPALKRDQVPQEVVQEQINEAERQDESVKTDL